MAELYLCLTPDWEVKETGLFRQNTRGQANFRFWRNHTDGLEHGLTTPPMAKNKEHRNPDTIAFAIEATPANDPDFKVTKIQVTCAPKGNGAKQASPFKDEAGRVDCSLEIPTDGPVVIGERKFYISQGFNVHRDQGSGLARSKYELLIVVTAEDLRNPGTSYEFSIDPEMQVDNS
jgi:hypothetical protein